MPVLELGRRGLVLDRFPVGGGWRRQRGNGGGVLFVGRGDIRADFSGGDGLIGDGLYFGLVAEAERCFAAGGADHLAIRRGWRGNSRGGHGVHGADGSSGGVHLVTDVVLILRRLGVAGDVLAAILEAFDADDDALAGDVGIEGGGQGFQVGDALPLLALGLTAGVFLGGVGGDVAEFAGGDGDDDVPRPVAVVADLAGAFLPGG